MALSVLGSQTSVLDSVIGGQKLYLDGKEYTGAVNEPKLSITTEYEAISRSMGVGIISNSSNTQLMYNPFPIYQVLRARDKFVGVYIYRSSTSSSDTYVYIKNLDNVNNSWYDIFDTSSSSNYNILRSTVATDDEYIYYIYCTYQNYALKKTVLRRCPLEIYTRVEDYIDLSGIVNIAGTITFLTPMCCIGNKLYVLSINAANVFYEIDLEQKTVTQLPTAPVNYQKILSYNNVIYGFTINKYGKYENGAWTELQPTNSNSYILENIYLTLFKYNDKIYGALPPMSNYGSIPTTIAHANNTFLYEFDGIKFNEVDKIPYLVPITALIPTISNPKELYGGFMEGQNHELYYYGNLYQYSNEISTIGDQGKGYIKVELGVGLYELRRTATGIHITN